jgi:type I restriction enzyme R subunit
VKRTSETAFETAIEAVLLNDGYSKLASGAFDSERAIFPEVALAFIRETQAEVWAKLEALHREHTGERVILRCANGWTTTAC